MVYSTSRNPFEHGLPALAYSRALSISEHWAAADAWLDSSSRNAASAVSPSSSFPGLSTDQPSSDAVTAVLMRWLVRKGRREGGMDGRRREIDRECGMTKMLVGG